MSHPSESFQSDAASERDPSPVHSSDESHAQEGESKDRGFFKKAAVAGAAVLAYDAYEHEKHKHHDTHGKRHH